MPAHRVEAPPTLGGTYGRVSCAAAGSPCADSPRHAPARANAADPAPPCKGHLQVDAGFSARDPCPQGRSMTSGELDLFRERSHQAARPPVREEEGNCQATHSRY